MKRSEYFAHYPCEEAKVPPEPLAVPSQTGRPPATPGLRMACLANVLRASPGAFGAPGQGRMCVAHIEMAINDSSGTQRANALLKSESVARGREMVRMTDHVRAVGFISKPGQTQELKTRIEGRLIDLLCQTPGFAGAMILHAQKESRSLWVLTFWEAEDQAANNCWEELSVVRKLLLPLIDVCTKVQTFQAILPKPTERCHQGKAAAVC